MGAKANINETVQRLPTSTIVPFLYQVAISGYVTYVIESNTLLMNYMASASGTCGYPATDVRTVGAMVTCCHGDTHELPSNGPRSDQLTECVTSSARREGKSV